MTLVDVATLARMLDAADGRSTVLDVRWRLGGPPGLDDYLAGHIPGAAFIDLDRDVSGAPGVRGRHPLPDPTVLEQALRAAGVRAGRPVVVYDAGDGVPAARLWWTLRWAGLHDVHVLDGGYAAWVAAGQPVESGARAVAPGDVVVKPGGMPVLDPGGAARLAREGVLIDARAAARYRGEMEPIDPVAGHIPGAVNVPAAELVDATGQLRPVAELRSLFAKAMEGAPVRAEAGGDEHLPAVGAYCGSGVTAAQTVLALHVAGIDASLYVGSWSEWIADPDRPIATGEHHTSTVEQREQRAEGA